MDDEVPRQTRGTRSDRTAAEGPEREKPAADEQTFYCDLCGNAMLNLHCKLICERCGYKRDCSDP